MPGRRVDALVAAVYAILTPLLTFPSPGRLRTHLPGDSGDAVLNLWILNWVGHHIDNGWNSLWDTTIFTPHSDTLAYSESLLPVAVVHRLVAIVLRSDVMAFNVMYLVGWFASMWFTYLLAKRLTGEHLGAFVAGLIYTLTTPRLADYWHFQLVFGFLVPVVLYLVLRFFEDPTTGRAITLGLVSAALLLSTSYYGLMTIVGAGIVAVGLLLWRWREGVRAHVRGLLIAGAIAGVLVAPVAYQYAQLQQDDHFERGYDPGGSARLGDYWRVTADNYLLGEYGPLADRSQPEDGTLEQRLFPGFIALGLGAVGAVVLARRLLRSSRDDPPDVATCLVFLVCIGGLVMFVLSFGDKVKVGSSTIPMPYAVLREMPAFGSIRAPARFSAYVALMLALLSALALAELLRARPGRILLTIAAFTGGVIVAESALEVQFTEVPDREAAKAVNEDLADRPDGLVVELPIYGVNDGPLWPFVESPRQWLARIDGQDRVNGYSGYEAPGFDVDSDRLQEFPSRAALETVNEMGIRYIVLRTGLPGAVPDYLKPVVDGPGKAYYSDEQAREMIDQIPSELVAAVDRIGDAYLIEMRAPTD